MGNSKEKMFKRPLTESIRICVFLCNGLCWCQCEFLGPEEVTFTPEPLRHVPLGAGESPRCGLSQRFWPFFGTRYRNLATKSLCCYFPKRPIKEIEKIEMISIWNRFSLTVFPRKNVATQRPFLASTCKWFNKVWRYWPWNYWRKS